MNIFCKYVSSFENDRFASKMDGPQPLGDFFAIDISGGYTLQGKMPVRFYLRVHNLTDKRYSTVVGYPDFGRQLYLGLQFKINKE